MAGAEQVQTHTDEEQALLDTMGYDVTLKREFTFWSAFAVAFAIISPLLGLYTIYGLGLTTGGAAFWWAFPLVLAGQLLTALVFAEMGSRYPLAGGVYQWARQSGSPQLAWFTGWFYIFCYMIAATTSTYVMSTFFCVAAGIDNPSRGTLVLISIGFVILYTVINMVGRAVIKIMMYASITAEAIGSVAMGTILLLFYRENSLSVILHPAGGGSLGSFFATGGFLACIAFVGWAFVGFEAAGTVSEEVRDPQRAIPKAIIYSLIIVAAVVMYSALAFILATPDLSKVVSSGNVADPIVYTLTYHLGEAISRPFFALVVIGFLACEIATQTVVSRAMFSWARDGLIPGKSVLTKVSKKHRLPVNALIVSAIIISIMYVFAYSDKVWPLLVSVTTGLFYTAFMLCLIAAFLARLTGRWTPGAWSLGRTWGWVVNIAALVWTGFMVVNIAWPRWAGIPWYQNWAVVIMLAILGVIGFLCFIGLRVPQKVAHAQSLLTGDDGAVLEAAAD